jgi:hypothetical protein
MRIIVYCIVAIGLIWIGVLESASSSVKDFNRISGNKVVDDGRFSIQRVLAVGLVGDLVVSKIISDGRDTVIIEGNEEFSLPIPVFSESAGKSR